MAIVPVVAAVIIGPVSGNPLLAKRDHGPAETIGRWEFPGGLIEDGETPEQAVVREIKEELNVNVEVIELLHAQVNKYKDRDHSYLVLFYRCQILEMGWPVGCVVWREPSACDCLPGAVEAWHEWENRRRR